MPPNSFSESVARASRAGATPRQVKRGYAHVQKRFSMLLAAAGGAVFASSASPECSLPIFSETQMIIEIPVELV